MDINEATAKALQAARAVSGLTFDELAQKSGVNVQTIYRMFGAKRDIKVPQLYALASAMGVTVVDLMQDAERIQEREARASAHGERGLSLDDVAADEQSAIEETLRAYRENSMGLAASHSSHKHDPDPEPGA